MKAVHHLYLLQLDSSLRLNIVLFFWTGWLRLIDFTAVIEWEPNVGLIHRVGFSAIVVRCHHFSPLFFLKLLIQYVQIKSIDNWWCDLLKSLNFFIVLCINCPCYMYHMKCNAWSVLSYQYPLVLLKQHMV